MDGPRSEERVVLVDPSDREVGSMEKLRAHEEGALHRAVSVFVFDRLGRLLMQQRSATKYHGARLWSNSCCGHPRPGEAAHAAAVRRLREEMGLECPLRPVTTFIYRAQVGALVEHEVDHIFVGLNDREPRPNPSEVMAWRTVDLAELEGDLEVRPERYTPWLSLALAALGRAGWHPSLAVDS
ncbi:MAG TPA: isopentenyl-diphosphate Delta-isomerase [Gemmatimonadaceae bacterium]|nr:isopentenyl-diphosphate Delta-isomerase [Gemmatimonadaceae bacterium]